MRTRRCGKSMPKKSAWMRSRLCKRVRTELDAAQKKALELEKNPPMRKLPPYWDAYRGGRYDASLEVDTGVAQPELAAIGEALSRYPAGFHIHPKVKKLLEQRHGNGAGQAAD